MKLIRKIATCCAVILMFTGIAQAAEKYRGSWNGQAPSSITINSTSPLKVRYCFRTECSNHEPSGNINNMTFTFPPRGNFAGAIMTFKKTSEGYYGRYQVNGATRVSEVTMRKSAF